MCWTAAPGPFLSQTAQRENGYPLWLGERCIEVVYVDHPEGFTYPGWEEDVELNQYHWTDLQEDGRSLLPPGTMGAGEQAAIEIPRRAPDWVCVQKPV